MIDVTILQRYLPASVKNALKPYYRKMFPNQLCINFMVTFRCNYRCSYCPWVTRFSYSNIYTKEKEPTVEAWIGALDKLPRANIYISGGEPFLYDGMPELINGLKKHKILGLVTNATVKTAVYERIKKKMHLNVSYHSEFVNDDQFISKIDELRRIGRFHININLVATRKNIQMIQGLEEILKDHNVSLHIDPFVDPDTAFVYTQEEMLILSRYLASDRSSLNMLDFTSYTKKECSAGQNYINLMPDGTVFRCVGGSDYFHSPLKKRLLTMGPDAPYDPDFFLMGNLFAPDFKLDKSPVYCCLPCTAACDQDMATIKWLRNNK
ncbi:radical SAM protein [Candidatus Desantisbacteria bacterium]|nr:radical SAM protein [Candidatus Desantisbacteria bacterium]